MSHSDFAKGFSSNSVPGVRKRTASRSSLIERLRRLIFTPKLLIGAASAVILFSGITATPSVFAQTNPPTYTYTYPADYDYSGDYYIPAKDILTNYEAGSTINIQGDAEHYIKGAPLIFEMRQDTNVYNLNNVEGLVANAGELNIFGEYRSESFVPYFNAGDLWLKYTDQLYNDATVSGQNAKLYLNAGMFGRMNVDAADINTENYNFVDLNINNGAEAYLYGISRFYGYYEKDANGKGFFAKGADNKFYDEFYKSSGRDSNGQFQYAYGGYNHVVKNKITVEGKGSKLFATTSSLKNVNIDLKDGATLYHTNMNYWAGTETDIKVNTLKPFTYDTYDEYGNKTTALASKMRDYMLDYIDNSGGYSASSSGTITTSANSKIVIDTIYRDTEINLYDDQTGGMNQVYMTDCANIAFITGRQEGILGDTEVKSGTLFLRTLPIANVECIYGNKNSGTFRVKGDNFVEKSDESGKKYIEVISSGQVAFNRCDGSSVYESRGFNSTPTIQAKNIIFEGGNLMKDANGNNFYTNGARLWFNTYSVKNYETDPSLDSVSARNIGAMNAETITFNTQNKTWYDRISAVRSIADINIELNADNYILVDGVTNTSKQLNQSNINELDVVFAKPLISTTYTKTDSGYTLTLNTKNVEQFADESGMSAVEKKYASQIDQERFYTIDNNKYNDMQLYDALYNESDSIRLRQLIHNISLLGIQTPQISGHFGNPTSAFFGGTNGTGANGAFGAFGTSGFGTGTLGGAMIRGQARETDDEEGFASTDQFHSPQQSVFNDNYSSQPNLTHSAWASFTHTSINGKEYEDNGFIRNGYDVRRSGVIGGIRRQINDTTSGGIFFSYSEPEVDQDGILGGELGNSHSSMEMKDFQFAAHLEKVFAGTWEAAFFLGGGTQSMDWTRDIYDNTGRQYRFESDGTGNTFTATAYLAKRLNMTENWVLRPTIGVDSEHSWLFAFSEDQTIGGRSSNIWLSYLTDAYDYDKMRYSRNTARAGLASTWSTRSGQGGFTGRAFYGVQLGGDDCPSVTLHSAKLELEDLETHVMGSESLNLGAGTYWHLNPSKTLTLTADYNALLYDNAMTQNATGGFSWMF